MDMTAVAISLLFGAIGMAFMMYGKKMAAFVPIGAGLGLMLVPYFISNLVLLLIAGAALIALPFVVRAD